MPANLFGEEGPARRTGTICRTERGLPPTAESDATSLDKN